MNSLLNTINSYPAVYADIFIVFVFCLILYLFTLFISKILSGKEAIEVEEKPNITAAEEVPVDLPPSEPTPEDVHDAFKSADQSIPETTEAEIVTEEIVEDIRDSSNSSHVSWSISLLDNIPSSLPKRPL